MDHRGELDTLMGYLGDFGKYQQRQFLLHVLAGLTSGIHMFSSVIIAAVPDHRCFIPEVDVNDTANNFMALELEKFIPTVDTGEFDSCTIYEYSNSTNTSTLSQCNAWKYDTTYHASSRGMEWNFVCHRKWMGAVATSAYMFGVFTGAVTLGSAADKYGRKTIFCISALLQLILGVSVAFVPDYYAFLIGTVLYGFFGSAGSYITGYILTIELVGSSFRTACSLAFQIAVSTGMMLVAGWGALIADRQLLQVVYGLHALVLIGHWWLMDESPRWLWANGKTYEAVKIIQKGLKVNRSPIQLDPSEYVYKAKSNERRDKANIGISSLFKTPNLRKRTLNICLCWFAVAIVYYFLAFGTGVLKGNPYFIFFLVSVVEIPGFIITILLIPKTGRRSLLSGYMIVGGICCIVQRCLDTGSVASIGVLILGKFVMASSFAIAYNYSAQLFPTVVRNSALGLGSMFSKIGGVSMPLLSLLDAFNPTLPALIFSVITIISGCLVLFLPETWGPSLPESIEDGENFGAGDTCFTTCFRNNKHKHVINNGENHVEQIQPLNTHN